MQVVEGVSKGYARYITVHYCSNFLSKVSRHMSVTMSAVRSSHLVPFDTQFMHPRKRKILLFAFSHPPPPPLGERYPSWPPSSLPERDCATQEEEEEEEQGGMKGGTASALNKPSSSSSSSSCTGAPNELGGETVGEGPDVFPTGNSMIISKRGGEIRSNFLKEEERGGFLRIGARKRKSF